MKPTLRYVLHLLLMLVAVTGVARAQSAGDGKFPVPYGPSNLGKEFVFSFPTNYEDPNARAQYIRLYITSPVRTRVQIYTGTVLKKTVYTIANDIISFDLTKFEAQALSRSTYDPVPPDQIYRKHAVRVIADEPIVLYGMNRTSYTSDGMLILPVNALGTDYVVAAARDYLTGGFFRDILPSQFVVTAAFDNTNVTIETPMATPNHREGEIYSMSLNKGDVFSSMSYGPGGDLTGAVISASKPVAVTAGQNCTYLPDQRYPACDHIEEMLFPISTWGTVYHSVPFATRLKGDLFRIFASEDGTDIYINGVQKFNLVRRGGPEGYGWIEYLPPTREILEFSSNKPIMIAQYNNSQNYDGVLSDPFYMVLTPVEQYQTQIVFTTPKAGDFRENYMTVVADSAGYTSIEISKTGSENWENLSQKIARAVRSFASTINGRRYVGVTFDLPAGAYKMRGPLPFAAYVYGFDSYDSYGYPLSAALSEIRSEDKDPPIVDKTVDCSGNVAATVLDLPEPPIRSNLSSIDLLPTPESFNYQIDVEPFEEGVSPAGSYRLTVTDRTKDARAIVRIYDKAGNVTYDTVDYTAIDIAVLPTPQPFGNFFTGTSLTKTVTLENRSKRQVEIKAIRLQKTNVGFTLIDPTTSFTLDSVGTPGARKDVTIRFDATVAGRHFDSLGLEDECGFRWYSEVNATVGTPIIEVTDHDFGSWPITAPPSVDQIEIRNISTDGGVLTVTGVAQDINDKVTFTLPNGLPAFPFDLVAGEAKVLVVAFKPAAVQAYVDSIVFSHNAPANPANDSTGVLRGRGIQGSLIVTSVDWGRRRVQSGPFDSTVTLTNVGTANVTLRTPLVLNGDQGDFTVDESGVTNRTLQPNQSIDVPVSFNPTRTGDRLMTITFPHDPQQSEPVVATLKGFGTVPSLVTIDMDYGTMDVGATPVSRQVPFRLTDVAIPDTIDQVTIVRWELTGDVADFSCVDPGQVTLKRANGFQEVIDIVGTFSATQPGPRTARLRAVTATGDNVDAVSLWTGVGVGKDPMIAGEGVSFGVLCAESPTIEAEIENTGLVDLVISDIALVSLPTNFSIPTMTFPITLAPGEKLMVPITFASGGNGVFNGFLNVTNNSVNQSPVMQLPVQGASVQQDVDARVVLTATGPAGRAELGKDYIATVRIDEAINTAIPVTSLVVTLTYDPALTAPDITKIASAGGTYASSTVVPRAITTPGTLVVDVTSPTPFSATGDLFTIPFSVYFHESLQRTISATITQDQKECLTFTTLPATIDVVPICGLSVRLIELTSTTYALRQNSPNPFNPTTKITYSLGLDGPTKILLTDASGRLVQVLLNEYQQPGTYEMTLDVTNLPSGLYYYTLQSGHWSETRSMMVAK